MAKMRTDSDIEVTTLGLDDEADSHSLAMRSYWEVIEDICTRVAKMKLKSLLTVFIVTLGWFLGWFFRVDWDELAIDLAIASLPQIILYSTISECIIYVLLPIKSFICTLIWLAMILISYLLHLYLHPTGGELLELVRAAKLLFLHILITACIYHVYRWILFKNVYWLTPDYRHLCSMWLPTENNKNHMLLAKSKQDGKTFICGTIGIVHVTDEVAMLARMSVCPSVRGRGIAKRLLNESLQDCREKGYKQVILSTSVPTAQHMYQQAGFQAFSSYTVMCFVLMVWYYVDFDGTISDKEQDVELTQKLKKISERCSLTKMLPET